MHKVQKTPWPEELNVTCHETIKCNLTLKNNNIFKFIRFQRGSGPWQGAPVLWIFISFLYYFWLYTESVATHNKCEITLIISVVAFHYPALCRFNPTIDRLQWMGKVIYAMLKSVSLWNQCGIVCDITPLQNFFFDITPVLSKLMWHVPFCLSWCIHAR